MAESEKPKPDGPPESPTTARELDFDDEPLDTPASPNKPVSKLPGIDSSTPIQPANVAEQPPPQPPRPLNPRQQAENTLREAFPTIDFSVVKAVLTASGGNVEPAFNALLGMSDPDAARQDSPPPPPQPPRRPQNAAQSQLEADEAYARRLAEQYNGVSYGGRRGEESGWGSREPRLPRQSRETGLKPNELYDDRERSFIDDDLPEIRDNIKKGFAETQKTVTGFLNNIRKRLDGEDGEIPNAQSSRTGSGPQYPPRRSGEYGRRSADRDRYDADPEVLADNFEALQLRDEEASTQPRRTNRPLANPDLFKPTPTAPTGRPSTNTDSRVSFQEGPPQDIDDLYHASPDSNKRPTSSKGKWQPLSTVDPSPVVDHDPFSLGDSDDEDKPKDTGIKLEEKDGPGVGAAGKGEADGAKKD